MTQNKRAQVSQTCLVVLGALLSGLGVGCSSEDAANIGDGELSVDKSQLDAYAAVWTGYVEAHTFYSGTDRVRVFLDEQGEGWLQVGEGELIAGPTDPTVGYPPALQTVGSQLDYGESDDLFDGFRYPVSGAVIEEERLRFTVDPHDVFNEWCAMQTPTLLINTNEVSYSCVAFGGWISGGDGTCMTVTEVDGDPIPIDCTMVSLCLSVCSCDATACTAQDGAPVSIDAALDDEGSSLTGSALLPTEGNSARTLRLER